MLTFVPIFISTMNKISFCTIVCACSLLSAACHDKSSKQEQVIAEKAVSFARSFYNLDRETAIGTCTPEYRKFIDYTFSNITEEDLAIINQAPPTEVLIKNISWENDSCAYVTCCVSNAFTADSIACPIRIVPKTERTYLLVCRSGEWLVRTEAPQQNEK